jgi:biopolymer transport protein ExbD
MRYFETRKARIEIIPMIDIMLFLLVFFAMLTLRMIPTTGQVSQLPTSSTAMVIPTPKLLVEIRDGGALFVDMKPMSAAQLTERVRSSDAAKLAVTIAGSHDASLQQVMDVIDAVRIGGATQISLAARQSAP